MHASTSRTCIISRNINLVFLRDPPDAVSAAGLRNLTEPEWSDMVKLKRSNSQSAKYPPMNPATRAMLTEFYRPFNEKLAQLLGDDRYKWLDKQKKAAAPALVLP